MVLRHKLWELWVFTNNPNAVPGMECNINYIKYFGNDIYPTVFILVDNIFIREVLSEFQSVLG
jgi:hypothetical protein